MKIFSIDNIMFSVDYSFADNKEGLQLLHDVHLDAKDKCKLAAGNAKRVLRIS